MSTSSLTYSGIFDLKGKVALVTGGGTGIGLMIVNSLAANGMKVYIGSRRTEVLQKVADDWKAQGQTVIPCVYQVLSSLLIPSVICVNI